MKNNNFFLPFFFSSSFFFFAFPLIFLCKEKISLFSIVSVKKRFFSLSPLFCPISSQTKKQPNKMSVD